jgi:hypothetical protein
VKWAIIENIVTMVATAALVLGLYAMGAGGYAFFGLLLLTNINTSYQIKQTSEQPPADHQPTEKTEASQS